jgi:hypothetical protein
MMRDKLIEKRVGDNKKFRWRSHDLTLLRIFDRSSRADNDR